MRSLLLVFEEVVDKDLLKQLKNRCEIEIVRFDLAWELFLGDKGINQQGELHIPAGNPRTQWLPLNLWVRQTLGSITNIIGKEETYTLGVISRCSSAAFEYVSRMMSLYSQTFGSITIGKANVESGDITHSVERFFINAADSTIKNEWFPPIVNLLDNATPLIQQTSGIKNDGHYTWLSGILGSSRLFSQVYQLQPNSSGNRLHSHSDVDEMFVVLEGTGSVKTVQGLFPIKKGDVVSKPGGSSLSAQFLAGKDGITILDIECWMQHDQTDVVIYPEHQEAAFRGRGLHHGVSLSSFFYGDEITKHYHDKYQRDVSGKKL